MDERDGRNWRDLGDRELENFDLAWSGWEGDRSSDSWAIREAV